jgi:hypothetical protein
MKMEPDATEKPLHCFASKNEPKIVKVGTRSVFDVEFTGIESKGKSGKAKGENQKAKGKNQKAKIESRCTLPLFLIFAFCPLPFDFYGCLASGVTRSMLALRSALL